MNMLLHHQKRRNLSDGSFVNIGEDGCPYADNQLLIVADGLGGRGGYPHTRINPDILNREIFYNRFIEPVLGVANDQFACFVTDSFHELFELNNKYFSSTAAMRTSGYFASRLVTAIVLHEIKFNSNFRSEVVFSKMTEMDDEMQYSYIKFISGELAKIIQERLSAFADIMGLELESKTTGSYLLPTTLTIALINEKETNVDILYLWAGDSRGYIWNIDGLAQITDDHERDETMTNLITLTKPFTLEPRIIKNVPKPVILFNATDGCYKCPCFASPFDLEYVILQSLNSSNDFVDATRLLDGQFTAIGTHDDSNTMALATFGLESFDVVKTLVTQRLKALNQHIISKLPDILERDYIEELGQIEEQIEGGLYAVKDSLIEIVQIKEFVKQQMIVDGYAPYRQELNCLQLKIEEINESDKRQHDNIFKWVQYYWLRNPSLKQYTQAARSFYRGDSFQRFAEMERVCADEKNNFVKIYSEILDGLHGSVAAIIEMRDSILSLEAPRDKEIKGQLSLNIKSAYELLDKIDDGIIRGKIEKTFTRYYRGNAEINDLTERYVKQERDIVIALTRAIISENFKVDGINMPQVCRLAIESYLEILRNNAAKRQEIELEISELTDKHLLSFWNSNFNKLIIIIQRDFGDIIPIEIKSRIADNIGELQTKREEVAHCLDIRNQLYELYGRGYFRFFQESTL